MLKYSGSIVVAALLSVGCASVPTTNPSLDAEAKSFNPAPGSSVAYVYRPKQASGWAVALNIVLDGKLVGANAPGTFLMLPLMPGPHVVSSRAPRDSSTVRFEATADSAYFFEQRPRWGWWHTRTSLERVSSVRGRTAVGRSKRAVTVKE